MQTVYLLNNCRKSYTALKKLYNFPDLSTLLIIVDREQAEILLLDKRVKRFPFIINTLPSSIGLIPKIAKVLPLDMFMALKKFHENNYITSDNHGGKVISIPSVSNIHLHRREEIYKTNNKIQRDKTKYNKTKYNKTKYNKIQPSIAYQGKYKPLRRNKLKSKFSYKYPLIKTEKQNDGSVNIILNK